MSFRATLDAKLPNNFKRMCVGISNFVQTFIQNITGKIVNFHTQCARSASEIIMHEQMSSGHYLEDYINFKVRW